MYSPHYYHLKYHAYRLVSTAVGDYAGILGTELNLFFWPCLLRYRLTWVGQIPTQYLFLHMFILATETSKILILTGVEGL